MSYVQVKKFDQSKGGAVQGMCLANVIKGYSIPAKYPDAWTAWLHTQQHSGNAPTGVDVPLYFSYTTTIDGLTKNYGHIGVQLADGTFWSDGKLYANVGAYTANHFPKYVGWGESINDVKVIQQGEDMSDVVDQKHLNILNFAFFGGGPYPPAGLTLGRPYAASIEALNNSPERQARIKELNDLTVAADANNQSRDSILTEAQTAIEKIK